MASESTWRKKADELLAAPPRKKRDLSTVAGKVEDRFEGIYAARQRGMAWKDIAAALENGDPINVDAVESAFMRICKERRINPPRKAAPRGRQANDVGRSNVRGSETAETHDRGKSDESTLSTAVIAGEPLAAGAATCPPQSTFSDDEARWVDDGE